MNPDDITRLQSLIDLAWDSRAEIDATNAPELRAAVEEVIGALNVGRIRVAERQDVGRWTVNQWVKKAVLLSFRLADNQLVHAGDLTFFDKVRTKFGHLDETAIGDLAVSTWIGALVEGDLDVWVDTVEPAGPVP